MYSKKWEKLKIVDMEFLTSIKKQDFLASTSNTDENIFLFVFISSFGVWVYVQYFFDVVRNQTIGISWSSLKNYTSRKYIVQ